ncbi:hypothetical protein COV93_00550 [Candidatus Woesearchaeota archaeon CG11_big_fil_rev_8_21_14_0_20_43_8]|nr:MAG: hypothetical protein COV93_00550 [Candidatus Woesearchaeota archaeon CG11_big_fil_rev_8_21_14_0_20_43_8]
MESIEIDRKRKIVEYLLDNDILVDSDMLDNINNIDELEQFFERIKHDPNPNDLSILKDNLMEIPKEQEKKEDEKKETINDLPKKNINVKIVSSYDQQPAKRNIKDFVEFFRSRFRSMENILSNRRELNANLTSIGKILMKKEKEEVAIIGIVKSKNETKNGNIILEVEDLTGEIKILINKTRSELFELGKEIVEDEIIGIVGTNGDKIIFSNKIIFPDIPLSKEFKKAGEEVYAVFLSDLHIGSNNFLYKEFNKFLKWINCELGNDKQKEMASKIRYVFISGDLVDGVGIYPGQEHELDIKDICKQYELCAQLLSKIPKNIDIIIIPGNHDASRLSEPQPPPYKDVSSMLWEMPNVTMLSNPGIVNIHSSDGFSGFDVLMYHGFSFVHYADCVESIRSAGGLDRPELIMKLLLQKRHLAPTHSSALYIPDTNNNSHIINNIPDFFVSGHIHKASISNYRNITMICGSCWQSITSFEEKMGLHPEPGRVPIVNLQTRECKIIKFMEN